MLPQEWTWERARWTLLRHAARELPTDAVGPFSSGCMCCAVCCLPSHSSAGFAAVEKPVLRETCVHHARPSVHPEKMSRRSGRDPNASSFNLFTGEEVNGAKTSASRPVQHPFNRGSSLMLGDPDMPDDRFAHMKGSHASQGSAQFQAEHGALGFEPLGAIPPAYGYEYDKYPPEDLYEGPPSHSSFAAPAPSSNVWASSANPNSGNFLSERPSTHVSNAPGGRSTFTIGDPEMADDRFSHHTHRSNMGSSRRPRELAAPIGSGDRRPHVRSGNATPQDAPQDFFGVSHANSRRETSNSWARNDSQNSGNFLTDRPTTRVVAPPGGRNAMGTSFGWE